MGAAEQFVGTAEGGLGGEDDGGGRRRRGRGSRGSPVFVGAAGICDGTGPGCSGGYGICGNCLD